MGEGLEKGDEHPAYNHLTDTDSKMRSSAYMMLTCHLHAFYTSKKPKSFSLPIIHLMTTKQDTQHNATLMNIPVSQKAYTEMLRNFVKPPYCLCFS